MVKSGELVASKPCSTLRLISIIGELFCTLMDPPSESYRLFPRLFHIDFLKLLHSPKLNWKKPVSWAMASPLVFLRVYATLTISLVSLSGLATQVVETIKKHPGLLSESLNFFPRLYHTYHLPFRSFPFRSRVH